MNGSAITTSRAIERFYPSGELETATPWRRLGGYLLDAFIAFITLGIGWLIWSLFVWRRGQTPGKQLLRMYVMREDGSRAGGWYTFIREVLVEGLLVSILTTITFGIFFIVAALWCIWDRDRQCLWDKIVATFVAFSPNSFKPLTDQEFQSEGQLPPGRQSSAGAATA
jgi:uncharacterized RDD family membrane protein YckC